MVDNRLICLQSVVQGTKIDCQNIDQMCCTLDWGNDRCRSTEGSKWDIQVEMEKEVIKDRQMLVEERDTGGRKRRVNGEADEREVNYAYEGLQWVEEADR